jgi:hypothetical protein
VDGAYHAERKRSDARRGDLLGDGWISATTPRPLRGRLVYAS